MARYIYLLLLILPVISFGLGVFGIAEAASQSSANYTIERDVLGAGGGGCGSSGYYLYAVLGQPSAIGGSTSSGYKNYAGFWHPTKAVRAMPWLPLLLLDD